MRRFNFVVITEQRVWVEPGTLRRGTDSGTTLGSGHAMWVEKIVPRSVFFIWVAMDQASTTLAASTEPL